MALDNSFFGVQLLSTLIVLLLDSVLIFTLSYKNEAIKKQICQVSGQFFVIIYKQSPLYSIQTQKTC